MSHASPLRQAIDLLERRQGQEALSLLEALHHEGNDSYELMFHLGVARNMVGERQEAIMAFKRATQLQPTAPLAWTGMGIAYGYLDKHELAAEALWTAVQLGDDTGQALLNLARALALTGRCREAVDVATQARDKLPQSDAAALGLGLALSAWVHDPGNPDPQGTAAEGAAVFADFVEAFPESPWLADAKQARAQCLKWQAAPVELREELLGPLEGAMDTFDALEAEAGSRAGFAPVVLEIVRMLQNGLNASDPTARHTLESLPGRELSGAELLAHLYAGAQRLTIAVDLGIDFSREYALVQQRRATR